MQGSELKAWRIGRGLSQDEAATLLRVKRRTVIRYEAGESQIPEKVAERAKGGAGAPVAKARPGPAAAAPPTPPSSAEIPAHRLPRAYDFDAAPAFTLGAKRLPETNLIWGAEPSTDTRPASPGYQRIPGCIVICLESIPDPIPFLAPEWAGGHAIWTASGRIYHASTGAVLSNRNMERAAPDFAKPGAAHSKTPPKGKR